MLYFIWNKFDLNWILFYKVTPVLLIFIIQISPISSNILLLEKCSANRGNIRDTISLIFTSFFLVTLACLILYFLSTNFFIWFLPVQGTFLSVISPTLYSFFSWKYFSNSHYLHFYDCFHLYLCSLSPFLFFISLIFLLHIFFIRCFCLWLPLQCQLILWCRFFHHFCKINFSIEITISASCYCCCSYITLMWGEMIMGW